MKKPPPIILLTGLTALALGVSIPLSRAASLLQLDDPLLSVFAQMVPQQIIYLIIAVSTLSLVKDRRPPQGSTNRWLPAAWIIAALAVGTLSALVYDDADASGYRQSLAAAQWGFAIWATIVPPFCEELFFRKMFLDLYPENQTACWFSVLLFVFVHNRLDVVLVLAAVAYLFAYQTTGKLWVAIAAHAIVNACTFGSLAGFQA